MYRVIVEAAPTENEPNQKPFDRSDVIMHKNGKIVKRKVCKKRKDRGRLDILQAH